jgi:PhoPQ-activated pathogenicity-related protein
LLTSAPRFLTACLLAATVMAPACALAAPLAATVDAESAPAAAPAASPAALNPAATTAACRSSSIAPSDLLACYLAEQAASPVAFKASGTTSIDGVVQHRYTMISQSWSPEHQVTPAIWKHRVDTYVPARPLKGHALLVINDGINHGTAKDPAAAAGDFAPAVLATIARASRTIVVSVSDTPNQYLTFSDDHKPRAEDDAIAHSWSLYLDGPASARASVATSTDTSASSSAAASVAGPDPQADARQYISLCVPMTQTVVKAMDLAQQVLKPWDVQGFVVTGVSKRGWGSWLTALVDPRVDAIVPFVMDMLNTRAALTHTAAAYGNNWPLAFEPYYAEGIDRQLGTPNFEKLMKLQDPMQYLDTASAPRLQIPKYVVNASGDDFFVPDNARLYFDQLPGMKALRVAPNSSHDGILRYTQQSLTAFLGRFQTSTPLPTVQTDVAQANGATTLQARFAEAPASVKLWTALDRHARDFRYACGIRYKAKPLTVNANGLGSMTFREAEAGPP